MSKTNVYYFNPTCELAVANGSFSYMPPLLLQEMERDLAVLPFVFCSKADFVLTENPPTQNFLKSLEDAGFELPVFCPLNHLETVTDTTFDAIYPWGWSPAAHFRLKLLKTKCADSFKQSPVYDWKNEHQILFERSTSLELLKGIVQNNPPDWFINDSMTGKKIIAIDELDMLLKKYRSIVVKAPLSSSGRGIQIIRNGQLNTSNKQWISGILKQQNYLIAEPYLDKRIDLSFQFRILPNSELHYSGYTIFETNPNGQYKGTLIHPDLKTLLPDENSSELEEMINSAAKIIANALGSSVYSKVYPGFLGVDAMIFRHEGKLMMQPCIEINSRMNMGMLTQFLEKQIHPESSGKFELFYGKAGDFAAFAAKQGQLNRIHMREGKIFSGFLPLVEPEKHNRFGAYITLGTAK